MAEHDTIEGAVIFDLAAKGFSGIPELPLPRLQAAPDFRESVGRRGFITAVLALSLGVLCAKRDASFAKYAGRPAMFVRRISES